jgi:hypothetical protein
VRWTVPRLQAHLVDHNRRVILLAPLTVFVATALWYVLYAILYWLTLLALSTTRGIEARPPAALPTLFIYSGALLVFFTWIASRLSPDEMPRDRKTIPEVVADLLLAIPRATLAVWGNLSAYQRLTELELEYAADLLSLLATEKRLPLHELPREIPDRTMRSRIVLALQLVRLLDIRRIRGVAFLLSTERRGELATQL